MRRVQVLRSGRTNLCQKIRATQGKGLMPDGTPVLCQGQAVLHYMGTAILGVHVLPEIAVGRSMAGAARQGVPAGCGIHGIGAVLKQARCDRLSVGFSGLGA